MLQDVSQPGLGQALKLDLPHGPAARMDSSIHFHLVLTVHSVIIILVEALTRRSSGRLADEIPSPMIHSSTQTFETEAQKTTRLMSLVDLPENISSTKWIGSSLNLEHSRILVTGLTAVEAASSTPLHGLRLAR